MWCEWKAHHGGPYLRMLITATDAALPNFWIQRFMSIISRVGPFLHVEIGPSPRKEERNQTHICKRKWHHSISIERDCFYFIFIFYRKIDSRFYLFIITLYNWKERKKKKKCLVVKKMENHWFVWFAFFKKCFKRLGKNMFFKIRNVFGMI